MAVLAQCFSGGVLAAVSPKSFPDELCKSAYKSLPRVPPERPTRAHKNFSRNVPEKFSHKKTYKSVPQEGLARIFGSVI